MSTHSMSTHAEKPVVVIGGGIGGLSTAITLAAQGIRVALYEQQESVGGKMSQIVRDGYRWDTGPSVITMRHVFARLFAQAGRRLEDYLDLVPVDPLTRYFYPDGVALDVSRDWPEFAAALEQLAPDDVAGYLRFLAYAADIHRVTGPVFIYDQPPTLGSFLRVPPTDMLRVDAWSTMHQAISRHVRSPHLRQLLGRFATYVGASPYQAPATLSVVAHVELTGGVWYPRGGIYQIAEAMRRLALELGVSIHNGRGVARILTEAQRAVGIALENGETVPATAVVANVDVATVYKTLLAPTDVPTGVVASLTRQETSCSGFILLLGIKRQHARLAHHNIFFSADYPGEFRDIFSHGRPPQDPTIYVAITSKSDPDHAPEGHENWFILVNAPAADGRFDWTTQASAYRDHVLAVLARHGYDIRNDIASEVCWTPLDIAARTGAWRGALYGISSNNALNAFRRPHNRCPHLAGLYFAGGTTHPGGGVPMVTLSGMVAADLVAHDQGVV